MARISDVSLVIIYAAEKRICKMCICNRRRRRRWVTLFCVQRLAYFMVIRTCPTHLALGLDFHIKSSPELTPLRPFIPREGGGRGSGVQFLTVSNYDCGKFSALGQAN